MGIACLAASLSHWLVTQGWLMFYVRCAVLNYTSMQTSMQSIQILSIVSVLIGNSFLNLILCFPYPLRINHLKLTWGALNLWDTRLYLCVTIKSGHRCYLYMPCHLSQKEGCCATILTLVLSNYACFLIISWFCLDHFILKICLLFLILWIFFTVLLTKTSTVLKLIILCLWMSILKKLKNVLLHFLSLQAFHLLGRRKEFLPFHPFGIQKLFIVFLTGKLLSPQVQPPPL